LTLVSRLTGWLLPLAPVLVVQVSLFVFCGSPPMSWSPPALCQLLKYSLWALCYFIFMSSMGEVASGWGRSHLSLGCLTYLGSFTLSELTLAYFLGVAQSFFSYRFPWLSSRGVRFFGVSTCSAVLTPLRLFSHVFCRMWFLGQVFARELHEGLFSPVRYWVP